MKKESGKTILEILSICETEFKAFSGLLRDRMMQRLQRHSSSVDEQKV
jgi:hypothetical protein